MKLVLRCNRALEFEEDAVRARTEQATVIAIFVGTLPKMNRGNWLNHTFVVDFDLLL